MKRPPTDLADRLRIAADELLAPDRVPSVDEMATRAGVPRATLYYYFSGREDLLDFLLLDKVEQIGAAVAAAAEQGEDPLAGLHAVLSTAIQTIAAHPTLCTTLLSRLPALSPTAALGLAVEQSVLRPLRELLESGIAAGSFVIEDPELSAHALYGAISMAAMSQIAQHGRIDADRLAGALVPQLVASVRADSWNDETPRRA